MGLSYNQLTGPIPREFGGLDGLQVLLLEDNQLTDEIPPELGDLPLLNLLRLAGNRLSGCIPAKLKDSKNHDLHLVALPFCTPEGLLPVTGGHVPPTSALLIFLIIGATVGVTGLCTVLRGERSTSPS